MVEIRYGENYEVADLAGKSVAEIREQYKSEFGIPDRAKVSVNGKPVKKKLEPKVMLNEGDELCFQDKQRSKMPFFVAAVMLTLAITGGVFAYGYTTAGVTLGVIDKEDWATVTVSSTANATAWDVFGGYIGELPLDEDLFDIVPVTDYTGDFEVRVYLTNTDKVVKAYRYLNMKLELVDLSDGPADVQGKYQATLGEGYHQILNLRNAEVTFLMKSYTDGATYNVRLNGGSYMSHPGEWFDTTQVKPELWCEVTQSGLSRISP